MLVDNIVRRRWIEHSGIFKMINNGRITEGNGVTVNCKSVVFIMTSNIASTEIARYATTVLDAKKKETLAKLKELGGDIGALLEDGDFCGTLFDLDISSDFKKTVVQPLILQHFRRNEFLGRISEFVYFLPFSHLQKLGLVRKELEYWRDRVSNKHNIQLSWGRDVEIFLVGGYDIAYGARSIKHEVARSVVVTIADAYELKSISNGDCVILAVHAGGERGRITLRVKTPPSEEFREVE